MNVLVHAHREREQLCVTFGQHPTGRNLWGKVGEIIEQMSFRLGLPTLMACVSTDFKLVGCAITIVSTSSVEPRRAAMAPPTQYLVTKNTSAGVCIVHWLGLTQRHRSSRNLSRL
jgi:hypothetical protein